MDKYIREKFNDHVLAQVVSRYGLEMAQVSALGGFESFVYEFVQRGQPYILRIAHSSHRTADEIQAEIEWINYLADRGVPAARAVPSAKGNWIEVVEQKDGHFVATAFVKARGTLIKQEAWQPSMFYKIGLLVGRMHALTKSYAPSKPAYKRRTWHQELTKRANQDLPPSEQVAIDKFNNVIAHLCTLPMDRDAYGLVHTDVHRGNMFVDQNGALTLFDFDDSQYSWFVDDIAMALFYAVPHDCTGEENLALARSFLDHFLRGYDTKNDLDPAWLRQIPHFLKARELAIYSAIYAAYGGPDDFEGWDISFMNGRKEKIANDVPYIDLDFESV
ncbi:MAG: phosphotransferase [Anaerolineae bacterium]|nr:phosphotransferase [Anaerolineae bacterium]